MSAKLYNTYTFQKGLMEVTISQFLASLSLNGRTGRDQFGGMWLYTRVVHSITFKLTNFVWELSTVLHVELDLIEDITTTQTSYKFLPM